MEGRPYRLHLIGSQRSGKTSLIKRYVQNSFSDIYAQTIGMDFMAKFISFKNEQFKILIFDTSGKKNFYLMLPKCIKYAQLLLFVYDITDRQSFKEIQVLFRLARQTPNMRAMIYMLVGNKSDLQHKRQISEEQGAALAAKLGMEFIETSARDATNVQKAFSILIPELVGIRKQEIKRQSMIQKPPKVYIKPINRKVY